ncbi:hypothetical protein NKH77_48935 [Streptomyces sp. M19]
MPDALSSSSTSTSYRCRRRRSRRARTTGLRRYGIGHEDHGEGTADGGRVMFQPRFRLEPSTRTARPGRSATPSSSTSTRPSPSRCAPPSSRAATGGGTPSNGPGSRTRTASRWPRGARPQRPSPQRGVVGAPRRPGLVPRPGLTDPAPARSSAAGCGWAHSGWSRSPRSPRACSRRTGATTRRTAARRSGNSCSAGCGSSPPTRSATPSASCTTSPAPTTPCRP